MAKSLVYVLVGYLILVAAYFIYLETGGVPTSVIQRMKGVALDMPVPGEAFERAELSSVHNYASFKVQGASVQGALEQKYEKIASMVTNSASFESDEQEVRREIKSESALIQEESSSLHSPYRTLNLTIGVPPEHFDSMVADLRRVGTVVSLNVTKTDKTNEYLALNARRVSLEGTRDALTAMKSQGGRIEELIKLEQEIAALDGKIQDLGVNLGHFDKVNEFCTVRLALIEVKPVESSVPHLGYLLRAIEWAGPVYLFVLACAICGIVVVLLVWGIAEKTGILAALRAK